jgi:3-oxoacyl-[acyl-carrier protein] reductase
MSRTCVITGASRGIGAAIATELGSEGSNVVVNYRSSEREAYDVVEAVEAAGGTAIAVQADVTDADAVEAMADHVRDVFGPADVLVNNAGVTADRTFRNMDREAWDRVIDVNLGGTFNATKAFYDDLRDASNGRLVNVSSIVGEEGNYGQANYAASKSGLFGFTKTLAQELASSGTTANCVAPGFTETDMLAEVDEAIRDQIREDIPLDRFASVEDVASAVRFLASEESSYVTGQVLSVNGGMAF